MRIVSYNTKDRSKFDLVTVNGINLVPVFKGSGDLVFEEHEYGKVMNLTKEPSVISIDEYRTLTGFFITNFQHAWVDGVFQGTASFRFTGIGDRLDLI